MWNLRIRVVFLAIFAALSSTTSAPISIAQEPIESSATKIQFERHQFTVTRQRGKISINGSLVPAHPLQTHAQELALIQWFDSLKFTQDRDFFAWAGKLNGTRTYTYDEVIQIDDQGARTVKPLVLFTSKERETLDPLWRNWLDEQKAAQEAADQIRRKAELEAKLYEQQQQTLQAQQQSFQAQADAASRSANSLAILSGETSLWEVELVPQGRFSSGTFGSSFGTNFYSGYETSGVSLSTEGSGISTSFGSSNSFVYGGRYVQVYGRTSQDAANNALYQNPGYRTGGIRRLSHR